MGLEESIKCAVKCSDQFSNLSNAAMKRENWSSYRVRAQVSMDLRRPFPIRHRYGHQPLWINHHVFDALTIPRIGDMHETV